MCRVRPDIANATCLVAGGTLTAKVWVLGRGELLEEVSVSPRLPGAIASVAFSPSGTQVMTADAHRTAVKIWDVSMSGDAEVVNMPGVYFFSDVAFMPDGLRVARTDDGPRMIAIWDLEVGRTVQRFGPQVALRETTSTVRGEPGREVDRFLRRGRR